jgi:hypothetical protein
MTGVRISELPPVVSVNPGDVVVIVQDGVTRQADVDLLLGSIGLEVGVDVQPYDPDLTTYASIPPSANVQAILGSANYAAIRALLVAPVTTQAGTSYTAVLADANSYITFTNGSAVTFTIPPNSSQPFPIGTVIEIEQAGAGALSVAAGAGVTINSRAADLTLAGQYGVAFIKKKATDTWTFNGDL